MSETKPTDDAKDEPVPKDTSKAIACTRPGATVPHDANRHHRQFRLGLVPMDGDTKMPIGGDEILMLRLRELDVAGRVAQMLARERARREVPQMVGRAEQNVGQDIGFIAESPIRYGGRAAAGIAAA